MKKICIVTGTRPQIIKTAPVIKAIQREGIEFFFVHTGQHYDFEMAKQFFDEFALPQPNCNLGVGSGDGTYQIYTIIRLLAEIAKKHSFDSMLVPGDTHSAFAAAITAIKSDIPLVHLEAGLRSYDMIMQEETNRRLIDHGASILLAPTDTAVSNLESENVLGRIYLTGDTMYDLLKVMIPQFRSIDIREHFGDTRIADDFAVLTFHRRENVENEARLREVMKSLNSMDFQVLFPAHPRTKKRIDKLGIKLPTNVLVLDPLPYTTMMALVINASLVITDSGGLQKEAYLLNTPCVTVRNNTEWIETIDAGANVLAYASKGDLVAKALTMWGKKLNNDSNVYGDGNSCKRIAQLLRSDKGRIPTSNMVD